VRPVALTILVAAVLVPFGVPRWLDQGAASPRPNADVAFAKLCRAHGGTPSMKLAGTAGTGPRCTVRYGRNVYLMDAITAHGFDADTAHYQRLGCRQAASDEKASGARGHRPRFVYHPITGVCERR
jgi:hypothetical protein